MIGDTAFAALVARLRESRGLAAKADIGRVAQALGLAQVAVPVGDDCAAIPDGDGFLLLAIEGFMNGFVAGDPWFAGWCGVMVNLSDIAAMGGRPLAVVDALWADGEAQAAPLLAGMRAASGAYAVPIVGGHSNLNTEQAQLSVAVLGRATRLLTSFDARPGERLVAAIDLRGRYRDPFPNWEAATDAPPGRLRADLDLLPQIAETGWSRAGKDISQAGLVGTAAMLAECSGVAIDIDLARVPKPEGVDLDGWLLSFPSFGFLLSVPPADVPAVVQIFTSRGIAAAEIGRIEAGTRVTVRNGPQSATVWDRAAQPLMGFAPPRAAA